MQGNSPRHLRGGGGNSSIGGGDWSGDRPHRLLGRSRPKARSRPSRRRSRGTAGTLAGGGGAAGVNDHRWPPDDQAPPVDRRRAVVRFFCCAARAITGRRCGCSLAALDGPALERAAGDCTRFGLLANWAGAVAFSDGQRRGRSQTPCHARSCQYARDFQCSRHPLRRNKNSGDLGRAERVV